MLKFLHMIWVTQAQNYHAYKSNRQEEQAIPQICEIPQKFTQKHSALYSKIYM